MPHLPEFPPSSLPAILKSKEKGNEAYSKAQFSTALTEYSRGLSHFKTSSTPPSPTNVIDSKNAGDPVVLLTSLLSNRSATYTHLRKYTEALKDADEVVGARPTWVKGFFRRGEALQGLRRHTEALEQYEIALQKDPKSGSIGVKIARIKAILEDASKGLVIHQLLPGRDLCSKSLLAPIQNLIFDYAIQMRNFIYVIENVASREALVVDACWDVDGILKYCANEKLTIVGALVTHYHFDHVGGIPPPPFDQYRVRVDGLAKLLKKLHNIKAYVNPLDIPEIIKSNPELSESRFAPTEDNGHLSLPFSNSGEGARDGGTTTLLEFIHSPGHTPGSQCVLVNGERLLSGDTLFIGSCGRLDFPDSDKVRMFASLMKLGRLKGEVVVYPGHDYGGEMTTIETEKRTGTLRPRSEADFLAEFSHD
ncbi:hypothetical protein HK097_009465 [Rhizophlyctis rosea]|uniref:Metallo-beta-lactamase domain-containing protein n=1 Tax=Rhizophlyctis rosea TaxID=64517 RepID=A0AAD5S8W2_9FUNG|nr:hypothetical protein HK097_009465 [Rhizophlyctis rosea]